MTRLVPTLTVPAGLLEAAQIGRAHADLRPGRQGTTLHLVQAVRVGFAGRVADLDFGRDVDRSAVLDEGSLAAVGDVQLVPQRELHAGGSADVVGSVARGVLPEHQVDGGPGQGDLDLAAGLVEDGHVVSSQFEVRLGDDQFAAGHVVLGAAGPGIGRDEHSVAGGHGSATLIEHAGPRIEVDRVGHVERAAADVVGALGAGILADDQIAGGHGDVGIDVVHDADAVATDFELGGGQRDGRSRRCTEVQLAVGIGPCSSAGRSGNIERVAEVQRSAFKVEDTRTEVADEQGAVDG